MKEKTYDLSLIISIDKVRLCGPTQYWEHTREKLPIWLYNLVISCLKADEQLCKDLQSTTKVVEEVK